VPMARETVRWMKNASFDHTSHQLVACAECHTQALSSQKTEDVLLPVIATCQKCHHDGQNAAGALCSECHVYHDWSKAKPVRSTNSISQFAR
jgi:transcription elongation factor Elf1